MSDFVASRILDLPAEVLDQWLKLCRDRKATGDWHHTLWQDFLTSCTATQKANGDDLLGHPGLNELYAALETIRRLQPGLPSQAAAKVFEEINPPSRVKAFEKFFFTGDRRDPDYTGGEINHLSLHSCKGMEFPIVWLSGCGFAYSVKDGDTQQGQPNLMGELGEWAKSAAAAVKTVITETSGKIDPAKGNEFAAKLENRRLLYVGMSRATDLLIISAPWTATINPNWKKSTIRNCQTENAFRAELEKALAGVDHIIINTDTDARDFAATITAANRNPTWTPPHRYPVESFTSLTRQPQPGENREVEIPREREFPLPQSRDAMIGDLFHRIMHLLCLETGSVIPYTLGTEPLEKLIARVSTRPPDELNPLAEYLRNFFSDQVNAPWQWLVCGGKSEVPFSHLTIDEKTGNKVLVKGFIDHVRFDIKGRTPSMILDYKTGATPAPGSLEDRKNADQLRLYREALATTYACKPAGISIHNYYPATSCLRTHS